MGSPKTVNIKSFHTYDKLHTTKVKMYSGVEITALYPIKETKEFYISPEVWSYCCSKFRIKKKNLPILSVNIPTISDQKTIDFLNEHAWHDWVDKELNGGSKKSEMEETIALLNRLFPDKKKVYFYEINNIIAAYNHGEFISYDKDGNIKTPDKRDIDMCKYYTQKYLRHEKENTPEIQTAYDTYRAYSNLPKSDDPILKKEQEEEQSGLYRIYSDLNGTYLYENFSLDSVFIEIGKNTVCYPVAFTRNTAEWSRKKRGKLVGYAHAGEIYFVVTPDTVYFEVTRHY